MSSSTIGPDRSLVMLRSHDEEDQMLFVYLPKPRSRSEEALADLSSWQDSPGRVVRPSRV